MNDTASDNRHDGRADAADAELLMSRLIDGEADASDRARFEALAARDGQLWRELAIRQQQAFTLSQGVDVAVTVASRIEIDESPAPRGNAKRRAASRIPPALAWTGWAAAVVFAAAWIITALFAMNAPSADEGQHAVPALGTSSPSASHELLRRYLASPFVVGELDPIMLQYEEAGEGLIELRILRRIEEAYLLDADEPLPVDSDGRLLRDPEELLRRSPAPRDSN